MTYSFPPSLHPLRDYLRGLGVDIAAFKTDRQAAFMAQQLIGSRVKFPAKGSDMTSTLLLIQKAVLADRRMVTHEARAAAGPSSARRKLKQTGKAVKHHVRFKADMFATGIHIFCDGAAVPNPGTGGWGVVVYRDGVEIAAPMVEILKPRTIRWS